MGLSAWVYKTIKLQSTLQIENIFVIGLWDKRVLAWLSDVTGIYAHFRINISWGEYVIERYMWDITI